MAKVFSINKYMLIIKVYIKESHKCTLHDVLTVEIYFNDKSRIELLYQLRI